MVRGYQFILLVNHLQLTDEHDFTDGFQLLHAVYVVECFLANLKKRKCNFHLVFLEGV